jgi:mannosyl-oligosaccharide alpha-1,2-mannosidase
MKTGRKEVVPGLNHKKPVRHTEDEGLRGTGKGRDYVMRKTEYLLRPEVRLFAHFLCL